jgi:hypothetical protein
MIEYYLHKNMNELRKVNIKSQKVVWYDNKNQTSGIEGFKDFVKNKAEMVKIHKTSFEKRLLNNYQNQGR